MKRFENYFVKSRKREIVYRRYLIFYYLYHNKGMTYQAIESKSGFDHATIIHGVKNATYYLKSRDREFMSITKDLGNNLLRDIYKNTEQKTELTNKIKDSLKELGIDSTDKYAICGQIGDRTFTVDGYINFIKNIL